MSSNSAAKAWRRSEQQRSRNRARRSAAKTLVRRAELTMTSADQQTSAEAARIAISALDQAAQKGALHHRSVARRKSHLMKKYSTVAAAVVAEEEAAPVRKRRTKKKEATAEKAAKKRRPSKKKEK